MEQSGETLFATVSIPLFYCKSNSWGPLAQIWDFANIISE